jgi:pseudouridine kinase
VRNSVGGVARNVAENLSRLEVPVILLTAIGRDVQGARVIKQCRDSGINCRHVRRVADAQTGHHVALLKRDGELSAAVSDFDVLKYVDSDYLQKHERLFAAAALVVIDLNLSEEALATVFELAQRYGTRVAADPTSPELAVRLRPYLSQLYLVTPNAPETSVLCGLQHRAYDHDSAIDVARQLVGYGVDLAVVTLGEQGLAYADPNGSGYIRAMHTNVVDSTGAGDALTGAAIFGLLNQVPVDEAMKLGVTAASLTLQTRESVVQDLSQELLYARLVV